MAIFTRKEYLNGDVTHRVYMGQFVNTHTIHNVRTKIGEDRILKSTDEHFNDIPLKEWDRLGLTADTRKMTEAGETYSLAIAVSINKAAAAQIKRYLDEDVL